MWFLTSEPQKSGRGDWSWRYGTTGKSEIRDQLQGKAATDQIRRTFFEHVNSWLAGRRFVEIAARCEYSVDDTLSIHTSVVAFRLQTLVEQAVALLEKALGAQELPISDAIVQFPEHLRFGVPTTAGMLLAARGVRHRLAAVELGGVLEGQRVGTEDHIALFGAARLVLASDPDGWQKRLGRLVFENTLQDLSERAGGQPAAPGPSHD